MKNNKIQPQFFPASELREHLRQRACGLTARLSRSVARLTSCDPLPCVEYDEEVRFQQALAQELFYLQHCRNALERCIGAGAATLRYRKGDGSVTVTRFRLVGPSRVRVTGFVKAA
jgi:hypothetical protein